MAGGKDGVLHAYAPNGDLVVSTILPNLQGQKYCFGWKFQRSMDEQTEFLFFPAELMSNLPGKGINSSDILQIVCSEDKYWISVKKEIKIYFNRQKLVETRELKFGDHFFLQSHSRRRFPKFWKKKIGTTFCFLERVYPNILPLSNDNQGLQLRIVPGLDRFIEQVNDTIENSDYDSSFLIGQNPVIVSEILSHLPHDHLKVVRRVSQLWNTEAKILLRQKSIVKFYYSHFYPSSAGFRTALSHMNDGTRFFRFRHEMMNYPLQNLEIGFPYFDSGTYELTMLPKTLEFIDDGNPGVKWVIDLYQLLAHKGGVKFLKLTGDIHSDVDYVLLLHILLYCQNSIAHLHLAGHMEPIGSEAGYWLLLPLYQWTKLTRFTISMRTYSLPLKFFQWWFEVTPNLVEISVHFPSAEFLKLLLGLNRLKKVTLGPFHAAEHYFEHLLRKHSRTLTLLSFIVTPHNRTIQIPPLPLLTKLQICYRNSRREQRSSPSFTFGSASACYGDKVYYDRDFPLLHSLVFKLEYPFRFKNTAVWHSRNLLNLFLPMFEHINENDGPPVRQECKTLRNLNIFVCFGKSLVTPRKIPRSDLIAVTFPNLNHHWCDGLGGKLQSSTT